MRRTPEMILSMTHQPYHGRLATMIARGKPIFACPECQTIHRRDKRATVLLKSWSHGWRITCPVCSSRLQEITEGKIYPPANASTMFGMKPGMARRCWPESTNFPPTGPRLRWLFCICCFCLAHALETMSEDKSGAAESLMSSSPALTTSTGTRRSPSILRRRSWRRYLFVSLCSRGFGEHKTTPISTTGSRALAVEERAFDSTPRKSNCSPTLIRHSRICSKFETRVRSGLAISCSESEKAPRSQDFVQRDICASKFACTTPNRLRVHA